MKFFLPLAVAAASLAACADSTASVDAEASTEPANVETVAASDAKAIEIVWEDLMPEGEMDRLASLYEDFYANMEAEMLSGDQSLMDAGLDAELSTLIPEGSEADTMEQIGTYNVVEDLDGERIRLPGYVVPFDFSADAEHSEFLLVPYFGACLHSPPPPPNQMLYVKATPAAKIDNIYDPVWLEGTISTGKYLSDLGNSAYELQLSKIEPYVY